MLINFDHLFKKYKIEATGVLHIGAHTGEEKDAYRRNGIQREIWVEANPEIFERLHRNVMDKDNVTCINACIGDKDGEEVFFNISSNDGQSSSVLQLGDHKTQHPDVKYVGGFKAYTKRIESIFNEVGLDIGQYTFLNIDLQGYELAALKGMGGLLHYVDWAYLEVNKSHVYENCPLVSDIDAYLSIFGFERVETLWASENLTWGDSLYCKTNLIHESIQ